MKSDSSSKYNVINEMNVADSRILLFQDDMGITVFFLDDGRIIEVWKERESAVRVADIYLGRVSHYAANIDAYYVEILKGIQCFLPASGLKLHEGEEILLQIKKEAYKTKLATASVSLEIPGRYSVISNDRAAIHYSKKLKNEDKDRIQNYLDQNYFQDERMYHILIRTAAADCEDLSPVLDEIRENERTLQQIVTASSHTYPLCKMYGSGSVLDMLFTEGKVLENTKIVSKDKALLERIHGLCWQYGIDPKEKTVLYDDQNLSMSVLYGLKSKLREITDEKIWLKSGGSIHITPTEALVVIDVNTGKYSAKGNREETFLKINLEAAKEIAFQIRARNLSGIILVDFINMKDENNTTILITDLKKRLSACSPPAFLIDITKLGIIEITREKKRADIYEIKGELNKTILM